MFSKLLLFKVKSHSSISVSPSGAYLKHSYGYSCVAATGPEYKTIVMFVNAVLQLNTLFSIHYPS